MDAEEAQKLMKMSVRKVLARGVVESHAAEMRGHIHDAHGQAFFLEEAKDKEVEIG